MLEADPDITLDLLRMADMNIRAGDRDAALALVQLALVARTEEMIDEQLSTNHRY